MVLRRWDPFIDARRMHNAMERMWDGLNHPNGEPTPGRWTVPLDVKEEGDNIVIKASLPGVAPENIDVTIEDRLLTIKGTRDTDCETKEGSYLIRERRSGTFYRALRLPDTVDADKVGPVYEHGVLTVTLPKAESKKAKRLTVAAGDTLEADKS